MNRIAKRVLLVLTIALITQPVSASQSNQVNPRLNNIDWTAIRGVNYIPSYGENLYEIWRRFNPEAFERELALAKKVGYNSVRLWLNYFAYRERGKLMVDDVQTAVNLCRKNNLKAIIVLFDSCGVRPRPDARTMTVKEGYEYLLSNPKLPDKLKEIVRFNYGPFASGQGKDLRVQLSADSSPHALLWQSWQPSPGYDKLENDWWPRLDRYVRDVVGRLAGDDVVLAWDIMNEPEWASEEPFTEGLNQPQVHARVSGFLRHMRDVIKKARPQELVTVGFATLDYCKEFAPLTDVLTFHVYGQPETLEKAFKEARDFSAKAGKPIVITETLANFSFMPYDIEVLATDEGQLKHYQKTVPTLMKSPIGWMAWGLVVGRIFDPYTDIFYANGYPRPAALYLEQTLKGQVHPLK